MNDFIETVKLATRTALIVLYVACVTAATTGILIGGTVFFAKLMFALLDREFGS